MPGLESDKEELEHLELTLICLQEAVLKTISSKSSFCTTELKYLGINIRRKGSYPATRKVKAIQKLNSLKKGDT